MTTGLLQMNMKLVSTVFIFCVISLSKSNDVFDEMEPQVKTRAKRVIGGTTIETGDWPWLVHLKGKIPALKLFGIPVLYKTYYCGASLINERWLLTAAHCFTIPDAPADIAVPKHWHAKLGDTHATHTVVDRLKSLLSEYMDEPEWRMWYLHAEKIIMHPLYDEENDWKHDIALVKLEEDIPLDDPELQTIAPVTLPESDNGWSPFSWPRSGTLCVMKGWGCTQTGGAVSNIARSVYLPIVPHHKCVFRAISNTRLCAGYNLGSSGICAGDSGGPLVCKSPNTEQWIQAGIASYTSAVRPDSVPGVFTRVANYVNWIQSVIDLD